MLNIIKVSEVVDNGTDEQKEYAENILRDLFNISDDEEVDLNEYRCLDVMRF